MQSLLIFTLSREDSPIDFSSQGRKRRLREGENWPGWQDGDWQLGVLTPDAVATRSFCSFFLFSKKAV